MEDKEDMHKVFEEITDGLVNNTMTGRILKAATKVIESKLGGDVLSGDFWECRIMAKVDDDIYIFFINWSKEEFPDPKISKAKFEEALCDFQNDLFESGIEDVSIIPGHIALWIQGDDRAFVRVTRGIELS